MSATAEGTNKHSLLKLVLQELACSVRSPAYDYLKSDVLSSKTDLNSALSCIVHKSDELIENRQDIRTEDNSELLLNSDEDTFYRIFKFKKSTVTDLIKVLEERLEESLDDEGSSISVSKKVILTVWLLTTGEEYASASNIFNIPVNLVIFVVLEVCSELTKLVGQFVKWPTDSEKQVIMDSFETQFGFSDVIGVIGCTPFSISRPLQDRYAKHFYNPASDHHSIVIQAVCDHQLVLRDVCAGFPSRRSPSEILRDSPLYLKLIDRKNPLMEPQTFILGSRQYPQLSNLLTPYSPEGRDPLNKSEQNFNHLHSSAENLIHKCFESMRLRFARLRHIVAPDPPKATQVVLACCVLHNFALMQGDSIG